MATLGARYIIDEQGNRVAVVLDIEVYQRILEELEDLEAIRAYDDAKASQEPPIPLEEALRTIESEKTGSRF